MNAWLVRWIELLVKYVCEIKYIKEKKNQVAYALNWRVHAMHAMTINSYETDLVSKIVHAGQLDQQFMQIKNNL